ncbi:MAG: transcription termination factor Rho [Anaerofustis stercorihominis]|nr:transcription termination factor Rho [Anaerofustis stercorihominis]
MGKIGRITKAELIGLMQEFMSNNGQADEPASEENNTDDVHITEDIGVFVRAEKEEKKDTESIPSEKTETGRTPRRYTRSHNSADPPEKIANGVNASQDKKYSKLKDAIDDSIEMGGTLQLLPEGFGFMKNENMRSPEEYVYVSASQVQRFKLVSGDELFGKVRAPRPGEKYYAMLFLEEVNGVGTQELIAKEKEAMSGPAKDLSIYEKSHEGILDIVADGFGFLRTSGYLNGENDIYISPQQIRKYRLREGDMVSGKIRLKGEGERYDALLYVEEVNGIEAEKNMGRKHFDKLVPVFPDEQYVLETDPSILSTRILDLFAPIGKGQRGLIVSPPKAGKTVLLKQIAMALNHNYPDCKIIILLIDERPEEVTDIQRSLDVDVVFSTFDQKPISHIKAAEIVLERAKRLVEMGEDVIILMDSITRFARANNLVVPSSGRTLSGGLDPESLYLPKKFFGSARNIEGGGSLTILATALIDTGSRMDDIIYEEFKGTGNMEVHLERELAERRMFPAINIQRSGTRREDLLLSEEYITAQYSIRGMLSSGGTISFTDNVIQNMSKTRSNRQFVDIIIKNYASK